jgi:hypothetical protein
MNKMVLEAANEVYHRAMEKLNTLAAQGNCCDEDMLQAHCMFARASATMVGKIRSGDINKMRMASSINGPYGLSEYEGYVLLEIVKELSL